MTREIDSRVILGSGGTEVRWNLSDSEEPHQILLVGGPLSEAELIYAGADANLARNMFDHPYVYAKETT